MDQFEELDDLFSGFGIGIDSRDDGAVSSSQSIALATGGEDEWEEDEHGSDDTAGPGVATRIEDFVRGSVDLEDSESDSESSGAEQSGIKCTCKENCLKQFPMGLVDTHILTMREMEKGEKEMYVMGSLVRVGTDNTRLGKRMRTRYRFLFHGKSVCKQVYCYINDIGAKVLKHIQAHMNANGIVPRVHGNVGRTPHHALKYEEVRFCVEWLVWYGDINGLPMPAAPRGHDGVAPVFLPSSATKKALHKDYEMACADKNMRKLGISSFRGVWKNCVPHIKIMTPRDDVCHKCELMRRRVADAVTETEKLDAASSLSEHVQDAQTERQLYRTCIVEAVEEMAGHQREIGPVPALSTDFRKVHYTFDYSQNVTIPHHSQQMGPMFFVTGRKLHLFAVRVDSTIEQFNYVIDEHQSIGPDGTGTHNPNSVISMLHHCMASRGLGEKGCVLHADNCPAQNKNRYMLAYLCWRVHQGLHENITLLMTIPGHTKCLVDGGFGHIKKLFKRSDCESLAQFAQIIDRSSKTNIPVLFMNENEDQTWTWYDWKAYLATYFLPLKGIQKLHAFRFTADDKGSVYVKERSTSAEVRVPLLKKTARIPAGSFPVSIQPGGLSRARQEYLYRNVRQYVRPEFQDVTCPSTLEE